MRSNEKVFGLIFDQVFDQLLDFASLESARTYVMSRCVTHAKSILDMRVRLSALPFATRFEAIVGKQNEQKYD